jgi:hypothetical protein
MNATPLFFLISTYGSALYTLLKARTNRVHMISILSDKNVLLRRGILRSAGNAVRVKKSEPSVTDRRYIIIGLKCEK